MKYVRTFFIFIFGVIASGALAVASAQTGPKFEIPARPGLPGPEIPRPIVPAPVLDSSEEGDWVPVCLTELRYMNLGGPYGLTGFGRDLGGNYVHFAIGKSGIKLKVGTPTSIAPYLLPASDWFLPHEQPDVWSFLREAAGEGVWLEFWAWNPNANGERSVTQIRRRYAVSSTVTCPPAA